MKIQIDNNNFLVQNISIQYTIDNRADIRISLNSNIDKTNLDDILNTNKKINIKSPNYEIINCYLRYISNCQTDSRLIILYLNGEIIHKSTINRRNKIINQLLKKNKKNEPY